MEMGKQPEITLKYKKGSVEKITENKFMNAFISARNA